METKLLARIGAAAFVAAALTMTALELREEPQAASPPAPSVFVHDGDPLPARLRACAAMGEMALSMADCRAAWAEKRRRFLGRGEVSPVVAAPRTGAVPPPDPVPTAGEEAPAIPTADAATDVRAEARGR